MNTDRLIETLTRDLTPAAPLPPPWMRAAWWLLGTVAYLAVLILMMASPIDVATNGARWPLVFYHVAAVLTALTAAAAAFASTVPGFSRRIFFFPIVAAGLWLGSLAGGAVQDWSRDAARLAAPGEWACVAMIVFGSALPGVAMSMMLRRGAPLTPRLTAGIGMLASGTLASVAACLSHPHPSDAVTFVWHGVTILALAALAAGGSRLVLRWNNRG